MWNNGGDNEEEINNVEKWPRMAKDGRRILERFIKQNSWLVDTAAAMWKTTSKQQELEEEGVAEWREGGRDGVREEMEMEEELIKEDVCDWCCHHLWFCRLTSVNVTVVVTLLERSQMSAASSKLSSQQSLFFFGGRHIAIISKLISASILGRYFFLAPFMCVFKSFNGVRMALNEVAVLKSVSSTTTPTTTKKQTLPLRP